MPIHWDSLFGERVLEPIGVSEANHGTSFHIGGSSAARRPILRSALGRAHLAHLNGLAKVHAGRRVRLPQGNEAVDMVFASVDPLRGSQNWTVEELGHLLNRSNVGAGFG